MTISVSKLFNNDNTFKDALWKTDTGEVIGWAVSAKDITNMEKIRVTFTNQKPKTGYAYISKDNGWLNIRYTKTSMRYWSLLNYNNPLIKLELLKDNNWVVVWEKEIINGV